MLLELPVTTCNHLVEASHRLSLDEQRLILFAITKLDSQKQIHEDNDNDFVITAFDFAEKFHIPQQQAYEALQNAADRLYDRDIKIIDKKAKTRDQFRWISGVKYWDGDAKIRITFPDRILPYLQKIHAQFTSFNMPITSLSLPQLYEY